jgi:hypothetical protein
MLVHESFWVYRRRRWLKLASLLAVAAAVALAADEPPAGRGGDTWLGYGLGTVCIVLMFWLAWFGIRKRSYRAAAAPLRGWLSAHVYLGLALAVLVPLHSAGELDWNLHGAAFLLTLLVIASGMVGAVVYTAVPERVTRNRPGEKLVALFEQIEDLDTNCRALASSLPDEVARAVLLSVEQTRVGGGIRRLFSGRDPRCATRRAVALIAERLPDVRGAARADVEKLLELLDRKRTLLARIRHDLRLKAALDFWLYAHVPLASAALVAVVAHVFVVFYYR